MKRDYRDLNLWSLEERRKRQDLIEVFKICKGLSRIRSEELFHFDNRGKGTRDHSLKLIKVRCMRDSRRHFFQSSYKKVEPIVPGGVIPVR